MTRAVGVDVADVVGDQSRILHGAVHGHFQAGAGCLFTEILTECGGEDFRIGLFASVVRMFERFQNEEARAFRDDARVVCDIERTARQARIHLAPSQQSRLRHAGVGEGVDGSIGAARDNDVGAPGANQLESAGDGLRARDAGGRVGMRLPHAGNGVGDGGGGVVRLSGRGHVNRHAPRAVALQPLEAVLYQFDRGAANAEANIEHTSVAGGRVKIRIEIGQVSSGSREEVLSRAAFAEAGPVEDLIDVEILHLARDFAGMFRRIEKRDVVNPAFGAQERLPKSIFANSVWRHDAESRDDYARSI